MTPAEKVWLQQVAANVVQSRNDRGGAPLGWMARTVDAEREARAEYGNEAVDAAIKAAEVER